MATLEKLEQHTTRQRRLALVALMADQRQPTDSCLDAEHLAALVEGTLTQDETDRCMAHLARCDHCTSLWQRLDQEQQRLLRLEQRDKRRKLLKKPSFLTITGSLLAAAASIAVFLTITTRLDRTTPLHLAHHLAQPPTRDQALMSAPAEPAQEIHKARPSASAPAIPSQQEMPPMTPATETVPMQAESSHLVAKRNMFNKQESTRTTKRQEDLPAPTVTGEREQLDTIAGAANAQEDKGYGSTDSTMATTAPAPPARMAQQAAPASPPLPADAAAPLTLEAWLQRLRRECTHPPAPNVLTTLAGQGRRLLDSATLDAAQRRQVTLLVDQLERTEQTGPRCRAVLKLLGPATPARHP